LRLPADSSRIEEDVGALERRQPRSFRIPLIPAHEHADVRGLRSNALEPEIARREVELLIEAWIVGNVHLAILAGDAALAGDRARRIVEESRRAPLEQAHDERHIELCGEAHERIAGRSGHRLRQLEVLHVLGLTEIARAKELRQADDLGAL